MNPNTETVKSAVVFGATGLVGKELVKVLLENRDFEFVTVVVRKQLAFTDTRLKQIKLPDFSKLMDLRDKLKAGIFFCCIGTTIKTAGSKDEFAKVDLEIPKSVARLAESLSVPSLVVVSSIGADTGSSNFYLRTKGEMEKAVREIFHANLKFVRPSLLMGDRDEFRFGEKVSAAFMKGFGWLFTGPFKKYKGIYARDVAFAMMKISDLPAEKLIFESDELQRLAKESLIK
ncbi:MAG TPA: hypothetical protein DEO60_11390 [Bacteroidales bacterium]|jgi:uncharacterized protein YbjT (DUF2867 family)|nr:hypothetical protein [Bacteroidales bacterium]HBZ21722.1 hypothetical protein [Bacteroidales bacterium]